MRSKTTLKAVRLVCNFGMLTLFMRVVTYLLQDAVRLPGFMGLYYGLNDECYSRLSGVRSNSIIDLNVGLVVALLQRIDEPLENEVLNS